MRLFGLIAVLLLSGLARGVEGPSVYEQRAALTPAGELDRLVASNLRRLGIKQSGNVCSDAIFIRRVYLDSIGTLPTADEVRAFLKESSPYKRRNLVEGLLEREEFAQYQTMHWCDVLRVKAEFPVNLWPNAAQAYRQWIYQSIRDNKPYDQFVREMLTSSGSNFRVPPVNFYRAVGNREANGLAQAVALTFMGVRAERWPAADLSEMAKFFSRISYKSTGEWKEEIVFNDPAKAVEMTAVLPDGKKMKLSAEGDPREVLADWLVNESNRSFSQIAVNRVWAWLMGRGIIEEVDDARADNPASNPELLAYLQRQFVASHYNLKNLYRLILNSRTYQSSCIVDHPDARAQANFASYPLRRVEAEVLIDAICQITGSHEKYTSAIPEPYTFVPDDLRSIALPDGSISSPFLEMFGKDARNTGFASERSNRPTAAQALHLLNSSHIQRKIEQSQTLRALVQGKSLREGISNLYLAILSRYPTAAEVSIVEQYVGSLGSAGRRAGFMDIAWALMNGDEFLYRH